MKRLLLTLVLLAGALQSLTAIPAYPDRIRVTQPDGSVITIRIHGDEWFHYITDESGRVVAQDKDGFFRAVPMPTATEREEAFNRRREMQQARRQMAKASSHTSGTHRIPVVLVQFTDVKFVVSDPKDAFTRLLNEEGYSSNGGTGSVRDFYVENSGGLYTPEFEVFGPVTLSHPQAYYPNAAASAIQEACKALNDEMDFSRYDSDSDGKVDMILMYYAGFNQAEGGGTSTIWPHQSYVNSSTKYDGKRLDRYFCTSELKGASGKSMCGVGPTIHEFAHSLGLPDFYDSDYEENGQAGGLYRFSTMCEGSYLNSNRTPPYFNSEERMMLGWMGEQTEIDRQGELTIGPIQDGIAYKTPTSVDGEYFVYECRNKKGWDSYLPGSGLIVYHVDKSTAHAVGSTTAYEQWNHWTWYNTINAYLDHPCFYIVPAADQDNLQFGYKPGISTDGSTVYYFDASEQPKIPFPGTKKVKTYLPVDWEGNNSDFRFTNITYDNSAVKLTVNYTTTPGVSGRVMNTSAKPVRGATVTLSGGSIRRSVTTDTDGSFSFEGGELADNTFTLTASCDGFVAFEATVAVGRNKATLDFYLRKVGESEEATFRKYTPGSATLSFGDGEEADLAAGIYLTADEVSAYAGKQLKSISFQISGNASATVDAVYVFVEVDGRRKLTQKADRVVFGALNTVNIVAKEFYVPSGSPMYIGIGVVGSSEKSPLLVQQCTAENKGYYGTYSGSRAISWEQMYKNGKYYTPVLSAEVGEPVLPELGFNHIANPGNGTYQAGSRFDLSLVRYDDDAPSSVTWTFDGTFVQGGSVTLTAGKHTIEAHLTYPDGSSEVIRLVITAS